MEYIKDEDGIINLTSSMGKCGHCIDNPVMGPSHPGVSIHQIYGFDAPYKKIIRKWTTFKDGLREQILNCTFVDIVCVNIKISKDIFEVATALVLTLYLW